MVLFPFNSYFSSFSSYPNKLSLYLIPKAAAK